MKTLVTIEFENETGNPSVEDIKLFVNQIIERGLVGPFDIYNHCSMSGISLRVLNSEIEPLKLTDKEIVAIEWAVYDSERWSNSPKDAAILRNLLERIKDK
jgi:hypothetical protein